MIFECKSINSLYFILYVVMILNVFINLFLVNRFFDFFLLIYRNKILLFKVGIKRVF